MKQEMEVWFILRQPSPKTPAHFPYNPLISPILLIHPSTPIPGPPLKPDGASLAAGTDGTYLFDRNFDYSDGLTTGNAALTSDGNALLSFTSNGYIENCLIIMSNWESNATINDVQCVTEYSGMFCGYQLA
ncbi:unnamed protein product [Caenorhabditis brenneri]